MAIQKNKIPTPTEIKSSPTSFTEEELKKLRTTGMTGKPYFKRGRKKYFPKEEGKLAHKIRKKND